MHTLIFICGNPYHSPSCSTHTTESYLLNKNFNNVMKQKLLRLGFQPLHRHTLPYPSRATFLKQLTVWIEREPFFSLSLKHHYNGYFARHMSMGTTENLWAWLNSSGRWSVLWMRSCLLSAILPNSATSATYRQATRLWMWLRP